MPEVCRDVQSQPECRNEITFHVTAATPVAPPTIATIRAAKAMGGAYGLLHVRVGWQHLRWRDQLLELVAGQRCGLVFGGHSERDRISGILGTWRVAARPRRLLRIVLAARALPLPVVVVVSGVQLPSSEAGSPTGQHTGHRQGSSSQPGRYHPP